MGRAGNGTGNLAGRRITISAAGRAVRGHRREAELWRPVPDGTIGEYTPELEQQPQLDRPRLRIA
jgi:hypothetical protein